MGFASNEIHVVDAIIKMLLYISKLYYKASVQVYSSFYIATRHFHECFELRLPAFKDQGKSE